MSKVTICIPTYNSEASIEETLKSILAQTYPDITIKIYDNASTDKTLEIVKQFSAIEIITSETNIGAEANFTRCIQGAEGEYTAIFHADDVYVPTIIEKQIKAFEKNHELSAVCTHANEINEKGFKIGERFIPKEIKRNQIIDNERLLELICSYGNFITCPSVMIKSKILKNNIQNWDGEKFKSSADLDLWLRVTRHGKMKFLLEPLINYRVASISTSYNLKRARTHRHDIFLVIDAYRNLIPSRLKRKITFLEMKDLALRKLNAMKQNSFIYDKLNGGALSVVKSCTHSKWHFSFAVKILAINVLYFFYSLFCASKAAK